MSENINTKLSLEILKNSTIHASGNSIQRAISNSPELSEMRRKVRDDDNAKNSIVENIRNEGGSYHNIRSFLPAGFEPRPSQEKLFQSFPEICKNVEIGGNYIIQKDTGTGKTAMFSVMSQLVSQDKQVAIVVPTIILGNQTLYALKERYPDQEISYQYTSQDSAVLPAGVQKSSKGRIVVFVKPSFINQINSDDEVENNVDKFKPDLVILDESHLCNTKKFNNAFDKIRKEVITFSFSATPHKTYIDQRPGYVEVWAGRSRHFTHPNNLNRDGSFKNVLFKDDKKELLENKESCPVKAIAAVSSLDFESQVKLNINGEYDQSSIELFEDNNWAEICNDFIQTYRDFPELQTRNKIMVACPKNIDKTKEAAY